MQPTAQPLPAPADPCRTDRIAAIRDGLAGRSIVLVGLMGAGKSTIGRRLAARLDLPFVDLDNAIETAAGMTIPEIFAAHGEAFFRDGERRVLARLLGEGTRVLATGGGAFMNAESRERIAAMGISVWLKAELDVLMRRVRRRSNRPLLQTPDPEGTMRRLMEERYPVYATAALTVTSNDGPHEVVVEAVINALAGHIAAGRARETPT
jgi:shikimate kinase